MHKIFCSHICAFTSVSCERAIFCMHVNTLSIKYMQIDRIKKKIPND